jgi:hypothetical protein
MSLLKVPSEVVLSCESTSTMLTSSDWTNRAWRCRESLGLDVVRMLCYDVTFHVSRLCSAMWTPLNWTGV